MAMPWANARMAHCLLAHRITAIKVGDGIAEEPNSDDYNQIMFTQNVETTEAFSSHVVPVKVERPTPEDVSMSWSRHYGLEMALCCRASPYKIHTQS